MKRRSFFGSLVGIAATLLAPPIRAARAKLRQLRPLHWPGLEPRWEHLRSPVPVPWPQNPATYGDGDAKIVTVMLRPTHSKTTIAPGNGQYRQAMRDIGEARTAGLTESGEVELYFDDDPALPAAIERFEAWKAREVLQVDREVPAVPERSRWSFGPED